MASLSKGTSFTDGVTGDVTAAKLHALVDSATPVGGLITDRTAKTSIAAADVVLISDSADSNNLKKVTVSNLANTLPTAVITNGTVTTLNATTGTITGANITTGTIATGTFGTTTSTAATFTNGTIATGTFGTTTGTAAVFTNGTLTTGVIPTGTFGTTTSTAASITTGTIPTLTIGSTTATAGTVTTLNSTTGTITNLSTTLAGDFTISQGTGTVGTRVAVVNTAQEYTAAHNFNATSLTITSGTIPWDLSQNQVAKLTVTTNSTMNNPTNAVDGATYLLVVTQGTGGSNTLSFGTAYKFPGGTAPSLSTGSSQVDVIAFTSNGSVLYGVTSQNFS